MRATFDYLISLAFVVSACTLPTTTIPTPTTKVLPTFTPDPFPNPVLKITGDEELVFDWSRDKCENMDIPDLPARAFRDAQGTIHLISTSDTNRQSIGPSLDEVRHDCAVIFKSNLQPDPGLYDDHEWLASPYTEDGQTIHALVHNEYQGHQHPGQCPQNEYFPCWDNSITLALSTDGGASYQDALPPPGHLVARLPYPYEAGAGPDGTRGPSNIIKGPEDYYYSFFNVSMINTQKQWVCLMRTKDLAEPASWRYWDGSGFDGQFIDPYRNREANPVEHLCPALAMDQIGASMNESVTYNSYLNSFVLVGISADHLDGRETWGYYYSFSDDLVHWTRRKLLVEMVLPWTVRDPGTDLSYLYPSLLDPDTSSRNFETTDNTAYLYYTRNNHGHGSLDRDLIRVPVEFFPSEEAYRQAHP